MDEEQLLRCEESLDIYDRTHHNPAYADHRMPVSVTARALLDEVRRLRQLLTEYGRHTEGCSAAHGDQYRCRCGWRDVEAGFK